MLALKPLNLRNKERKLTNSLWRILATSFQIGLFNLFCDMKII